VNGKRCVGQLHEHLGHDPFTAIHVCHSAVDVDHLETRATLLLIVTVGAFFRSEGATQSAWRFAPHQSEVRAAALVNALPELEGSLCSPTTDSCRGLRDDRVDRSSARDRAATT
jgi:hypothetical protein